MTLFVLFVSYANKNLFMIFKNDIAYAYIDTNKHNRKRCVKHSGYM
jgi:hypothetical protein